MKHWMAIAAGCAALSCGAAVVFAQAAQPTDKEKHSATSLMLPPSPKNLLPDAFSGWVQSESPKVLTDAAQTDPENVAALKEYRFSNGLLASYKRDGETLTLRAMRFEDASGAYGMYSFYRQNGWPRESIGTGATSNHNRVIFWAGVTVVDATFSHISPMSGGELREVARQLPIPTGNAAMLPPILANLPQQRLVNETMHYAVGPAGYVGGNGMLPPALVGFDKGAETVTANYSLPSGYATLTLIDYPTPQMAEAQENAIRAYIKAGSQAQPSFPKPLVDSDQASLEVRHSGPLVILVSGDAIPDESHRLLESVHYAAEMTAIPQSVESEVAKTSKLLINIAIFILIGAAAAIFMGGLVGGVRALYRVSRGKPISSVYDEEFIHLDLNKKWDENEDAIQEPHQKG